MKNQVIFFSILEIVFKLYCLIKFIIGKLLRNQIQEFLLKVVLPLFLGGIIYILFRTDTLLMFSWFKSFGLGEVITNWRKSTFQKYDIPLVLIYSLPDSLWVYSFSNIMLQVWQYNLSLNSIFWLLFVPIVAIFSEVGQFFNLISGTFDLTDLVFVCIALSMSYFKILNKLICNKNGTI